VRHNFANGIDHQPIQKPKDHHTGVISKAKSRKLLDKQRETMIRKPDAELGYS
jgi:hypothetical protein